MLAFDYDAFDLVSFRLGQIVLKGMVSIGFGPSIFTDEKLPAILLPLLLLLLLLLLAAPLLPLVSGGNGTCPIGALGFKIETAYGLGRFGEFA